jgi:hypothetical protein
MIKSIQKILAWINLKTIRFLLFVVVFFASLFCGCQSKRSSSGVNTEESMIDSLDFLNSKVKIYLTARAWGIAGNHEEIRIFGKQTLDSINLYTSEVYYKKAANDSLIVYVPQSAIPSDVKENIGEVEVHLISLNTQAEVMDYSSNYSKYGLIRISAINK